MGTRFWSHLRAPPGQPSTRSPPLTEGEFHHLVSRQERTRSYTIFTDLPAGAVPASPALGQR